MKHRKPTALILSLTVLLLEADLSAQQKQPPQFRPPENTELLTNIPYAETDNPARMLDLMLPKKPSSTPLPVVVFIHGGAFRAGDKQTGLRHLAPLAESTNYACISINYRLSGEAIWPAQIHDCKAAIRWVKANAGKYNMDAGKIGIWGSSAGGHLVAMLGTSADVIAMDGTIGDNFSLSCRVNCVVDFFGPTDFTSMDKDAPANARMRHGTADSPESQLMGFSVSENPEKTATASPITYISADDPPFLIVHGTKDPVVPYNQSIRLQNALNKAGVENTLITVTDGGHGFKGFGEEVNRHVLRFFDHHLRGVKSEWKNMSIAAENRR